jgi:hypothetical protein
MPRAEAKERVFAVHLKEDDGTICHHQATFLHQPIVTEDFAQVTCGRCKFIVELAERRKLTPPEAKRKYKRRTG